jgi:hypothetical protein
MNYSRRGHCSVLQPLAAMALASLKSILGCGGGRVHHGAAAGAAERWRMLNQEEASLKTAAAAAAR